MPRNYENQSPTAFQRLPKHKREDDWIREILQRGQIAHIASSWDAQPFINPTTFFYDQAGHRLIFHSNISGRVRANIEHNPKVCVEISEMGKPLPSNVALEFSFQYRSVLVFGAAQLIENIQEQTAVMHKLIGKYFGEMERGKDYRPVTEKELRQTSVYEIKIESWSGKENWKERADQSDEWPALDEKWIGY